VFLFFLLLFILTKGRGLGFGDVVYVFLMGLLLGFPKIILGLYIAFLSGAVISLILVIQRRKNLKGGTITFGPFLVGGTIISMLWGNTIIDKVMLYFL
jgi:prepilin signal peptidase PulO-like enzyme (type II secretory pathway)